MTGTETMETWGHSDNVDVRKAKRLVTQGNKVWESPLGKQRCVLVSQR